MSAFGEIPVPLQDGGVISWGDASNPLGTGLLPTTGTALSSVFDLSRNGNHAAQPTGGNQPIFTTNQQNGLPGIVFTAANSNYLILPTTFMTRLTTNCTIYVAVNQTSVDVTNGNALFFNNPDNAANRLCFPGIYGASTTSAWDFGNISGVGVANGRLAISNSSLGALSTPVIWTVRAAGNDGIVAENQAIYSGGGVLLQATQSSLVSYTTETCYIGRFNSGYTGMILLEWFISNKRDSAAVQRKRERYLGNKWGMPVV